MTQPIQQHQQGLVNNQKGTIMANCTGCDASCKDDFEKRLTEGSEDMEEMRADIQRLIVTVNTMKTSLDDFIELWQSGKGVFKVIKFAGMLVIWGGAIAAAITAFLHFGVD